MVLSFGVCLVVGGSGWLGSYLLDQLITISKNHSTISIHSIDVNSPPEFLDRNFFSFHNCDISRENEIYNLIKSINPTTIFHLASVIDLRLYPSKKLDDVNIYGTQYILNAISNLDKRTKRYLIYTSSIDVVSSKWGSDNADESFPYCIPSNGYKRTKIQAEKMVLSYNNLNGNLYTCAVRPGHIYGPGDNVLKTFQNVPFFLGPSTARMSVIYVSNCAFGHILAANRIIRDTDELPCSMYATSNSTLCGQAVFIKDFDVNLSDFYCELTGTFKFPIRIPRVALFALITFVELLERVAYRMFSLRLQSHPVTSITASMLEACGSLTISREFSRRAISYPMDEIDSELPQYLNGSIFLPLNLFYCNKSTAIEKTKSWVKMLSQSNTPLKLQRNTNN